MSDIKTHNSGAGHPAAAPRSNHIGTPPTPVRHLHQVELARRWRMSERTLERWRWLRQGPPYLKIGARVVYRLEDIEAYEADQAQGVAARAAVPRG
jgi:hypothetical protein